MIHSLTGFVKKLVFRGAWVAQSVKRPTLAQVMISQFVGSSPASGSVLTAWSLEPAYDSVSPSLSLPFPDDAVSPCLSKINKCKKKKIKKKEVGLYPKQLEKIIGRLWTKVCQDPTCILGRTLRKTD